MDNKTLDMLQQKTKMMQHQKDILWHMKDRAYYALLWMMGTSKTFTVIANAAYLFNTKKIKTAVVIVRKSLIENWEREINLHCSDIVNPTTYKYNKLKTKAEIQQVKELQHYEGLKFILINIESFQNKQSTATIMNMLNKLAPHNESMVILDEASDIKDPTSNRTKAILTNFRLYRYRRLLTGTAITESPENAWSLYEFLAKGLLEFPTFHAFKNYYCVFREMRNGSFTYRKIIGYRNLDKLKQKLLNYDYASRLTKEEVLHDLPDKITGKRIFVDMTAEQAKMYKEMKKEMATVFQDQDIEITSAITKHTKLMQIANGVIHTETEKKEINPSNPKTNALIDLIDDVLPKKVVVFCMLKSTILIESLERDLKAKYGDDAVVVFSGATSQEDRGKYVDQFQDPNSPVKIFIGNSAASRGLTLTAADVNVFYSNDYSFETREQAESRSHRMGQKNVVTIIDIVTRGTDEVKVLEALETKKKLSDFLMDIKKEYL